MFDTSLQVYNDNLQLQVPQKHGFKTEMVAFCNFASPIGLNDSSENVAFPVIKMTYALVRNRENVNAISSIKSLFHFFN